MTSRISKLSQVIVIVLALVVGGCSAPAAPSPIINITNNLINTVTLATPVPSEQAGCPAIGQIAISRPESLTVGGSGDLLVTPKDSSGKDRAKPCDDADGVSISANPSDILDIEDAHAFVTKVFGRKVGTTSVSVSVGNANAVVRISVR